MNLDLAANNPTWPILLGGAALVVFFMYGKKQTTETTTTGVSSLFTGSRVGILMSLVSLFMQAGNLREFARRLLAMGIDWANKQPSTPPVTPPPEPPTEKQ